jgi:DNA-binding beta-propeller fold protein YncE
LYVSNGLPPHAVTVYAQAGSKPSRIIRRGGGGTIVFDSSSNLYASNGAFDRGRISVYAAGTTKLLRQIRNIANPYALAVDGHGYLYVATLGAGVLVYGPGGTQIIHVIRKGAKGCSALGFDRAGNLYVANEWSGTVTVYAPGKTPGYPKLVHTIEGLHHPLALAFGPSGNLFVASHESVYVFKAGSLALLRTITGVTSAEAIAIDSIGRLYVSSDPFTRQGYQPGWVTVYPAGGTKPLRKITQGIDVPRAVALDAGDNVYVANSFNSSVTVFSPGGTKLLRTITDGVVDPNFLAFNSQ